MFTQTCKVPLKGCSSQDTSLEPLKASTLCSPSSGCKHCWRWGHSYVERCEVWQGHCGHGRGESWRAQAPWAGWTSTAPRMGHRRPPQSPPSAGEALTTADPLSPERLPGPNSPKSSILRSPYLPSVHLPRRRGEIQLGCFVFFRYQPLNEFYYDSCFGDVRRWIDEKAAWQRCSAGAEEILNKVLIA